MRIAVIPVNVEVGDHLHRRELALDEIPRELDRFALAQLLVKRELYASEKWLSGQASSWRAGSLMPSSARPTNQKC